jgi:3-mercaptopyruvate sulfurtransferase SseA
LHFLPNFDGSGSPDACQCHFRPPGGFEIPVPPAGTATKRAFNVAGDGAMVDVRSPEEFRGELLAPPHLPQ